MCRQTLHLYIYINIEREVYLILEINTHFKLNKRSRIIKIHSIITITPTNTFFKFIGQYINYTTSYQYYLISLSYIYITLLSKARLQGKVYADIFTNKNLIHIQHTIIINLTNFYAIFYTFESLTIKICLRVKERKLHL